MISEEDARMLALLADVLHGRKPRPVPAEAWPALKKELAAQTVCALPTENLADLGLSAQEEALYFTEIARSRRAFHRVMHAQRQALDALEAAGVPAVVLKGAAAAQYYPHPEDRGMGDVDLLVAPQDFGRALDALCAAGCTPMQAPELSRRHVPLQDESGVEIELHRFFSDTERRRQNQRLNKQLFRAIASRQSAAVCGYTVSVLPPAENGLVLLGHLNHHLSSGLGLRQIVDWMFYVEQVLDDEMWETCFAAQAEAVGMKKLAMLVTGMCRKYLGLEKEIHWPVYEPVCDELMEYILNGGNFGRKVEKIRYKTVSTLKKVRDPFRGLKTAQQYGLEHWEAAKRHRCLRPFAWCYQLVRWARHAVEYGVTANRLASASAEVKKTAALMKKLGVTRM